MSLGNVARPAALVTAVAYRRAAPAGWVPRARLTRTDWATGLPNASSSWRATGPGKARWANVSAGAWANTTWAAAAGLTRIPDCWPPSSPPAETVSDWVAARLNVTWKVWAPWSPAANG